MAVYDPLKVALALNGVLIQGFQKGTFFEGEFNEDVTTLAPGAQYGGTVGINRDASGTWKFTLQNASPSNAYMEYLLAMSLMGLPFKGSLVGPFGGVTADEMFVKKVAKTEYSSDPDTSSEWEVHTLEQKRSLEAIADALTTQSITALGENA